MYEFILNFFTAVIPITDKNRNLLPIHFSVDPGPDFTWFVIYSNFYPLNLFFFNFYFHRWKDADDLKIASKIELSEADQLSLMCEYMDITKILVGSLVLLLLFIFYGINHINFFDGLY